MQPLKKEGLLGDRLGSSPRGGAIVG